jgi:DNA-binding winged helix-turn-helix (wHTH) protein/pimeloyl-ACP methyl ester carboxylesterase
MPAEMRHLIILLPGLMGSVLQKDGKDIWALSGQALWHYLRTLGRSFELLRIEHEDWEQDDLDDGIRAVRLIEDIYSVPFIAEHAGYSVITRRIPDYFNVTEGSIHTPRDDANFFTFPYDWRRDNRVSARKLQRFVENQLPRWRNWSGAKDAQVILIGHSMGGLIARYYLEVLGGWRNCRALITAGSPHRGALGTLDVLSYGSKGFNDLNTLMRSFESMYQMLPTYPAVEVNGSYVRVDEASGIPNLNQQRAKAARENFLEAIRQAALQNRKDPGYRQRTIPWVGTHQDTLQSALLSEGKLIVRYSLPVGLDPWLADGDGTVPRVSAVPPDLDGPPVERFVVERHGWLMNSAVSLEPLLDTVRNVASSGVQELYGAPETVRPSVNLRLEPIYLPGEPISVALELINTNDQPYGLTVEVDPIGHQGLGAKRAVQASSAEMKAVEFENLATGLYQVKVYSAELRGTLGHGVFEVIASEAVEYGTPAYESFEATDSKAIERRISSPGRYYEWACAEERALARYVQPDDLPAELKFPKDVNRLDLLQAEGPIGIAAQLYVRVCEQNIQYDLAPFNPHSGVIQLIRKPETILAEKRGTSLDLAVLFATMCLANSLLPLIVLVEGHAFVGLSLTQIRGVAKEPLKTSAWNKGLLTDLSVLQELAGSEYFFVECTGAAQSYSLSIEFPEGLWREDTGLMLFERACEAGREQLIQYARPVDSMATMNQRVFLYALDIYDLQVSQGFEPIEGNIFIEGSSDSVTIGGGNFVARDKLTTTIFNAFTGGKDEALEHRNRRAMLEKVRSFWVKGVFEQSLHGMTLIEWKMEYRPEAVQSPWTAVLKRPAQLAQPVLPGTKAVQVFDHVNGELLILGAPGSGKTTMLLDLTRDLIARAEQDETLPIPVVFNLSSWAEKRPSFAEWLIDELNFRYFVPKKVARGWLKEDQVVPLLDGLDEVKPKHREACVKAINRFRQEHGLLPMVVCSRSAEYEALKTRLRLQNAIVLQLSMADSVDDIPANADEQLVPIISLAPAISGVIINRSTREVQIAGRWIDNLTELEFETLCYFCEHPNQVYSKDDLITNIYSRYEKSEKGAMDEAFQALISRLREKIEPDHQRPRYLVTIRGEGYQFIEPGFGLTPLQAALIQNVCRGYAKIIIENKFGGDYSGTHIFRILPIKPNGASDARIVTKIGPAESLRRERDNYFQYVSRVLPFSASQIPEYQEKDGQAALNYVFAGDILGQVVSLEEYYRLHTAREVINTLASLLNQTLGPSWYSESTPLLQTFRAEYERHLPEDLGTILKAILPDLSSVDGNRIKIPGIVEIYPDPLKVYPTLLDKVLQGRRSLVHGDLNLRNVLVDESGKGWLIDFANVEKRHNLFDFIKLETFLRMMALVVDYGAFSRNEYAQFEHALNREVLGQTSAPPANPHLAKAYEVIQAIRKIAQNYMSDRQNFKEEYLPALFLYSLSVTKYYQTNGVTSAQLIFITACEAGKFLLENVPYKSQDEFTYDVFISYSSQDQEWVQHELLKQLEAQGMKVCIDFRDFQPGIPIVKEIERALQTSRKTLLILTPAYLESAWAEIETFVLHTFNPANRTLIPLLKEECNPPPHISYLTYVDFTAPGDLDFAWRQLLTALGTPPELEPADEFPTVYYRPVFFPPPDPVKVGQRLQLRLELLPQQLTDGGQLLAVPPGAPELYCFVRAEGLDVTGDEIARLPLGTSPPSSVTFEFRARRPGQRIFTVEFFSEAPDDGLSPIFEAEGRVTVSETEEVDYQPILPMLDIRFAPQPDFSLLVSTDFPQGEAGPHRMRYYLINRLDGLAQPDIQGSVPSTKHDQIVGEAIISRFELARIQTLTQELVQLASGVEPEACRQRQVALGKFLYDRLFPESSAGAFREIFWQAADRHAHWTWLIIEDGFVSLPWELVMPYRRDDAARPQTLAERCRIGRWISGLRASIYGEVPFGDIALVHYPSLGQTDIEADLQAWERLINATVTSSLLPIVKPSTSWYGLHLLRHASQLKDREGLVLPESVSSDTFEVEDKEVRRGRLDLWNKRPIVSLSLIVDHEHDPSNLATISLIAERAANFLLAGAGAVIGPWWPTSAAADRVFWATFYDLLEQRVPLGDAVWAARLAVERALPERADWLAYTLFGDPRARPYWPEAAEGYAFLECRNPDVPLRPGKTYTFEARISRRPPEGYQDRLLQVNQLPDQVKAIFLTPGLQADLPKPVLMQPVGRAMLEAKIDLTLPQPGDYPLLVQFLQGDEHLKTLQLILKVGSELGERVEHG